MPQFQAILCIACMDIKTKMRYHSLITSANNLLCRTSACHKQHVLNLVPPSVRHGSQLPAHMHKDYGSMLASSYSSICRPAVCGNTAVQCFAFSSKPLTVKPRSSRNHVHLPCTLTILLDTDRNADTALILMVIMLLIHY